MRHARRHGIQRTLKVEKAIQSDDIVDYPINKTTYTGRFIMYSGITKTYYRKTVGHILMKPVQIEGTTHNPLHK
jgi:hypothetical protein